MVRELDEQEAKQFATMLLAGVPPLTAVSYFFAEDTEPEVLAQAARLWPKRRVVTEALNKEQGKNWLSMEPEERIEFALKKHYNEMAFFLYSNNYSDLDGMKADKADKCRITLEKKVAGAAGIEDPLIKLYKDALAGKVPGLKASLFNKDQLLTTGISVVNGKTAN